MDEGNLDTIARMVAALCSAIVCSSNGEKDHTAVLAGADMYLDFIKPFDLRVSSKGEVTFTPDTGEG